MTQLPRTLDEAADYIIASLDDESRRELLSIRRTGLIRRHHGWGTGIRNELGLRGTNPELLADCGSPTMEADRASMIIMCAVWNKLRGLPLDDVRNAAAQLPEDQWREFGPDMVYRMYRNGGQSEYRIYQKLNSVFGMSDIEIKDLMTRVDSEDAAHKDGHDTA